MGGTGIESELEKELERWRESRSQNRAATMLAAESLFRPRTAPAGDRDMRDARDSREARTVQVNGQPVLVVRRARRPMAG